MDNKKLGLILIAIAIIFTIPLIIFKIQVNNLVATTMELGGGTCIRNGICEHQQSNLPVYIGIVIIVLTLSLGLYLIFFEKGQKLLQETHETLVKRLEETKKERSKDEKFDILLKGLDEYEKKVINAVKEQDGIKQNTLRLRTDMSKSKLSLVLTELEKKNLIKKVPEGKTNKIYIKTGL